MICKRLLNHIFSNNLHAQAFCFCFVLDRFWALGQFSWAVFFVLDMILEVTMAINFPPALYVENARSGSQTAGWASTLTELEYVRAALRGTSSRSASSSHVHNFTNMPDKCFTKPPH